MILGHVEWEKKFDAAIAKGRTHPAADDPTDYRRIAIAELKALGISEGDAINHLDRKR